jgi:predicted  nucleic acid-binding Zn-ribbon protein
VLAWQADAAGKIIGLERRVSQLERISVHAPSLSAAASRLDEAVAKISTDLSALDLKLDSKFNASKGIAEGALRKLEALETRVSSVPDALLEVRQHVELARTRVHAAEKHMSDVASDLARLEVRVNEKALVKLEMCELAVAKLRADIASSTEERRAKHVELEGALGKQHALGAQTEALVEGALKRANSELAELHESIKAKEVAWKEMVKGSPPPPPLPLPPATTPTHARTCTHEHAHTQ